MMAIMGASGAGKSTLLAGGPALNSGWLPEIQRFDGYMYPLTQMFLGLDGSII